MTKQTNKQKLNHASLQSSKKLVIKTQIIKYKSLALAGTAKTVKTIV